MSAYEITPRWVKQVGRDHWKGRRTIVTRNANVQWYSRSMWDQVYTGFSGPYAPVVRETVGQFGYQGMQGVAALALFYETLRTPGEAWLEVQSKDAYEEVTVDLDGEIVIGPDPDGKHDWLLTSGSNLRPVPQWRIVVKTAALVGDVNLGQIGALMGKVNDSALPNFHNAAAGTLLLKGLRLEHRWGDDLAYLDYPFDWEPRGWNNVAESQKGVWAPVKEPTFIYDQTSGLFTDNVVEKYVLRFFPGQERLFSFADETYALGATEPESRRMFKEANFGALDSMIRW